MSDVVIVTDSDGDNSESDNTENDGVSIESEDAVRIAEIQAEAAVAIAETQATADVAREEARGASYDEVLTTMVRVRDDIVSALSELPGAVAAAVASAVPPPVVVDTEHDIADEIPVHPIEEEQPKGQHWWYRDNPVRG